MIKEAKNIDFLTSGRKLSEQDFARISEWIRKNKKKQKPSGVIDNSIGNYEKHPFFVKKANEAKAFIKKVGLPAALIKKK